MILSKSKKSEPSTETRIRTFRDPEPRKRRERRVKLYRLSWSGGEYRLSSSSTTFDELPREAVHVTGERNAYLISELEMTERSQGITASDLYLYMVNNSINEALAVRWDRSPVDMKKYIVYGIVGIVLVCVVWAMI